MEADFAKYSRFQKTIDRYRTYQAPRRIIDLKVHVLVGQPGTGKTRFVYDTFPNCYAFPIGKDLWADGYMGQPVVLLDDFSGQMRLVDTLRFLDRYPIQIPKKGGFNWWCPDTIFITTNIHPKDWYDWEKRPNQEQALKRRIHHIWDFDNKLPDSEGKLSAIELDKDRYWPYPRLFPIFNMNNNDDDID